MRAWGQQNKLLCTGWITNGPIVCFAGLSHYPVINCRKYCIYVCVCVVNVVSPLHEKSANIINQLHFNRGFAQLCSSPLPLNATLQFNSWAQSAAHSPPPPSLRPHPAPALTLPVNPSSKHADMVRQAVAAGLCLAA